MNCKRTIACIHVLKSRHIQVCYIHPHVVQHKKWQKIAKFTAGQSTQPTHKKGGYRVRNASQNGSIQGPFVQTFMQPAEMVALLCELHSSFCYTLWDLNVQWQIHSQHTPFQSLRREEGHTFSPDGNTLWPRTQPNMRVTSDDGSYWRTWTMSVSQLCRIVLFLSRLWVVSAADKETQKNSNCITEMHFPMDWKIVKLRYDGKFDIYTGWSEFP